MRTVLFRLLTVGVFVVGATHAQAAGPSCQAASAEKKLAGAAKTSFLKKCEKDATASCEQAASDKKLSGAARTSFTKKCVRDAVGEAPAVN